MKKRKHEMIAIVFALFILAVLSAACPADKAHKDLVKRELVYDLNGRLLQEIDYEYDYKGRRSVIHEKTTDDAGNLEDCYILKYSYESDYYDVERTYCRKDDLKTVNRYDYHDNELSVQFPDKTGQIQTYEYRYEYLQQRDDELSYICYAGDSDKTAQYTITYNEKGDQIGYAVSGFDKRETFLTTIYKYDGQGRKIRAENYDVEAPTPLEDHPDSVTVYRYDDEGMNAQEDTIFYTNYDYDRIERKMIREKNFDSRGRLLSSVTRNIEYDHGVRTEKETGNMIAYEYF